MSKDLPLRIAAIVETSNTQARELALQEVKDLRKDILQVERFLTGKRKKTITTAPLFDIVHGALELFRQVAQILGSEDLLQNIEEEISQAREQEFLERQGATLLTKPEGWHWISPQGEMIFLGKAGETAKAKQKLQRLKTGAKTGTKKGKKPTGSTKKDPQP